MSYYYIQLNRDIRETSFYENHLPLNGDLFIRELNSYKKTHRKEFRARSVAFKFLSNTDIKEINSIDMIMKEIAFKRNLDIRKVFGRPESSLISRFSCRLESHFNF